MWRRVVTELAADYPDVELRHGLVDSVAMQIVTDPESFDVLAMENTFGDILSDVAAAVDRRARPRGLGEPRRRPARDLRAGARLGARHRRHRPREPDRDAALARPGARARRSASRSSRAALEAAVDAALATAPTPDVGGTATTAEFGDAVLAALAAEVAA